MEIEVRRITAISLSTEYGLGLSSRKDVKKDLI